MPKRQQGFNLVELLAVIAILGIVIAFAYPAYREQLLQARRAEGLGELLELADKLERHYVDQLPASYAGVSLGNNPASDIHRAITANGHYLLEIDAANGLTFTVRAVPRSKQAHDKCGAFILDSLGNKSLAGNSAAFDTCWK
ncbi:MAG: type IV pilin protein, partial [Gammaproteobacteria bacterium]